MVMVMRICRIIMVWHDVGMIMVGMVWRVRPMVRGVRMVMVRVIMVVWVRHVAGSVWRVVKVRGMRMIMIRMMRGVGTVMSWQRAVMRSSRSMVRSWRTRSVMVVMIMTLLAVRRRARVGVPARRTVATVGGVARAGVGVAPVVVVGRQQEVVLDRGQEVVTVGQQV